MVKLEILEKIKNDIKEVKMVKLEIKGPMMIPKNKLVSGSFIEMMVRFKR